MNDDKKVTNQDNGVINNDDRRGLNESVQFENAQNSYQNNQPVQNNGESKAETNNEDIEAIKGGSMEQPESSGAFPAGTSDISKD